MPCVYLDIRASAGIDVTKYPDSGKINVLPLMEIYEKSSKVDYYLGEESVSNYWPKEILDQSGLNKKE